jgi:hypothetical protein
VLGCFLVCTAPRTLGSQHCARRRNQCRFVRARSVVGPRACRRATAGVCAARADDAARVRSSAQPSAPQPARCSAALHRAMTHRLGAFTRVDAVAKFTGDACFGAPWWLTSASLAGTAGAGERETASRAWGARWQVGTLGGTGMADSSHWKHLSGGGRGGDAISDRAVRRVRTSQIKQVDECARRVDSLQKAHRANERPGGGRRGATRRTRTRSIVAPRATRHPPAARKKKREAGESDMVCGNTAS